MVYFIVGFIAGASVSAAILGFYFFAIINDLKVHLVKLKADLMHK
jgi:hypothetical protein